MSNQNLNLPVLIYLAKDPCPACSSYNGEWEKVKKQLAGKARFVKFTCKPGHPGGNVPPPFSKYFEGPNGGWFPTILVAGPKSYFRIFTSDDKVNDDEYSDKYTIKAKKFNAVEVAGGYEYGGRPNTVDNTIVWFDQVAPTVSQYDEQTPPRKFAGSFSTNQNRNVAATMGQMGQNLSDSNGNSLKFYI